MHDHSLGGPVNVGRNPDAKHEGNCNDGVYGCSRCWNAANNGKGYVADCDWCKARNVNTRIIKAWDENVSYALCEKCRKKNQPTREELQEMDRYDDDPYFFERYEEDDKPESEPQYPAGSLGALLQSRRQ